MFMLQKGSDLGNSALTDSTKFREVELLDADGVEWRLFVKPGRPGNVRWVSQLKSISKSDNLADLRAQSSSAVLLVKHGKRVFAVTFGHGFHAVNPKSIERGFGLRVTANAISGDQLKSADTRALNRDGRSQKTMLPVASELFALDIEPSEEWVRQLSGTVSASGFASTAAGADSLRLNVKDFTLQDLPEKLKQVKKFYKSDNYKSQFGFLDNFLRLDPKDPIVQTLNGEVATMLASRDPDVHFAAPEPFEQLNVEAYQVVRYKKIGIEQLGQSEVYDALDKLTLPADFLDKVSIEALDGNGIVVDKRYPIFDYIQAEIPKGNNRYVLSAGLWFRVSQSYVDEVSQFVAGIDDITTQLDLPDWPRDVDGKPFIEAQYNETVAQDRGFALLDAKNVQFGQHRKIEVCDLLTPDRDLICIKRATRSSTLSHLFSQGSVSASLMNEPEYQAKMAPKLKEVGAAANFDSQSDWRFVFGIATAKQGVLAAELFFFSQVNLVTHVKDIRSRGYRVALAKISMG